MIFLFILFYICIGLLFYREIQRAYLPHFETNRGVHLKVKSWKGVLIREGHYLKGALFGDYLIQNV